LNIIMAHHTGQPIEAVQRDTERDFFMSAEEAERYGIIDSVLSKRDDAKKAPAAV
jgi:ATP-dependent Clp protease protease subunit